MITCLPLQWFPVLLTMDSYNGFLSSFRWILTMAICLPIVGYPPSRPYALTTAFHAATLIIGHLVDGCAYIVRISGDGIAARFLELPSIVCWYSPTTKEAPESASP